MKDKSVAVLLGGDSPERDVSLNSGATVIRALDALGARTRAVDTAEAGWWREVAGLDLAFIALHGAAGEDGTVQGALQSLGVPYTGSGVLASALAMDKVRSKQVWQCLGLPIARHVELDAGSDWQAVIDDLGAVFVKPVTGGSSIGTCAASTGPELQQAWQDASRYGARVMAEALIDGAEYTVSILGGEALPAICMETDNAFYDYEAKYLSDDTRYLCPCGLPEDEEAQLGQLALQAFTALGCEVWGRVDFMRGADGDFRVLEVNTVPGMTDHSLVPMAARARGIAIEELVGSIASLSLELERT